MLKLRSLVLFSSFLLFLENIACPWQGLANSANSPSSVVQSISACKNQLNAQINYLIEQPNLKRSHWGILIQNLRTDEVIYALNEDKYFIPASNVKLITSAVALLSLKETYRIRTSFWAKGSAPYLDQLRIVGKGDPSLTTEQLKTTVQKLKQFGIKQINQLIIDDSYFNNAGINPTWEWEDIQYEYAPTISSLTLNDNKVDLILKPQQIGQTLTIEWSDEIASKQWQIVNQTKTVPLGEDNNITLHFQRGNNRLEIKGQLTTDAQPNITGLSILDPTVYFLEVFQALLQQEGIRVLQSKITHDSSKENKKEILSIDYPLSDFLKKVNQDSDNLYAENLYQIVFKEVSKKDLAKIIDLEEIQLRDGSGLSRYNLIKPLTFVTLLKSIYHRSNSNYLAYKNTLAIAGVNGTLKSRFLNTTIAGKLWGKTGTLTGISALSGYLELDHKNPMTFSIMVNHSPQSSAILRQGIDDIIVSLNDFSQCQINSQLRPVFDISLLTNEFAVDKLENLNHLLDKQSLD